MGSVRAAVALATTALVFAPVQAIENPIWEQSNDCTGQGGVNSQVFPDFGSARVQAADDFVVTGDEAVFRVIAPGFFGVSDSSMFECVDVEVYENDGPGGLPGTLVCAYPCLPSANGGGDPLIDVTLDPNCALSPGTYWIAVAVVMDFNPLGYDWFWSNNNSANGSVFVWRDPDNVLVPDCSDWQIGTECVDTATADDMCMEIGGKGSVDIPAVGTTGVIVMLLVVMAASFYFLRRRRTT